MHPVLSPRDLLGDETLLGSSGDGITAQNSRRSIMEQATRSLVEVQAQWPFAIWHSVHCPIVPLPSSRGLLRSSISQQQVMVCETIFLQKGCRFETLTLYCSG